MNKAVKIVAVSLLFFSLAIGSILAPFGDTAQAASAFTARITVSKAKVHTGPGNKYRTIGTLYRNSSVTIKGKTGSWYKVSYKGKTRYIYGKYAAKIVRAKFSSYKAYVKSYSLKIRNKASNKYKTIRTIYMNTKVTVIGAKGSYAYIYSGGKKGYVQKQWLKSKISSYKAYVNAKTLNMRTGPSTTYKHVKYLYNRYNVTVSGSSNGWYLVKYGNKTGYVKGQYIKKGTPPVANVTPPPAPAPQPAPVPQPVVDQPQNLPARDEAHFIQYHAYVTSDTLDVFSEPDTTDVNKKITTLSKKTVVTVLLETGKYLKVNFNNGQVGFVTAASLLKGDGPAIEGNATNPSQPPTSQTSKLGIDISHWQNQNQNSSESDIDFTRVKNAGYQFVIMKATQGYPKEYDQNDQADHIDDIFYSSFSKANNAGLSTYAYHFFQANSEENAVKEADYFASVLRIAQFPTYKYVFVDVEDQAGMPLTRDKIALTNYVNAFLNELNKNGYSKIGLYTSYNFYYDRLNGQDLPNNMLIWIARYRYDRSKGQDSTYAGPEIPADIWQYRSDGSVDGITNKSVDINVSYFTDPNAF